VDSSSKFNKMQKLCIRQQEIKMKQFMLIVATTAICGTSLIGGVSTAEAACPNKKVYPETNGGCVKLPTQNDFAKGNARPKTIRVRVCITWFNKLNGAPGQKWWGMRLAKGAWSTGEKYKPVYSSCKLQNVAPGTVVFNDPDCFKRWRYATAPMWQAGATYVLTPSHRI
jgi:hypothetical protein